MAESPLEIAMLTEVLPRVGELTRCKRGANVGVAAKVKVLIEWACCHKCFNYAPQSLWTQTLPAKALARIAKGGKGTLATSSRLSCAF